MNEAEKGLTVLSEIPALTIGPFRATRTGLVVDGEPTIEEWDAYGCGLRAVAEGVNWLRGDWLTYGEHAYGEMYAQAVNSTDYAEGSLRNMKYVAANVPMEVRRADLPYSHHIEVAKLDDPDEQARWLKRASDRDWSRRDLAVAIEGARAEQTVADGVEDPPRDQYVAEVVLTVGINLSAGKDAKVALKAALGSARFPFSRDADIWVTEVGTFELHRVIDGKERPVGGEGK